MPFLVIHVRQDPAVPVFAGHVRFEPYLFACHQLLVESMRFPSKRIGMMGQMIDFGGINTHVSYQTAILQAKGIAIHGLVYPDPGAGVGPRNRTDQTDEKGVQNS